MKNGHTIKEARELLDTGKILAIELTEQYLKKIEEKNPELNAYLTTFENAKKQARAADERIKNGSAGALTGIPLGIKDVIMVKGETTSASSKILENYKATYDATAISRLREAGAVFLGHTNCDEFAMGASNENSAFGPVKNPHDLSRVSGGSSGGSAAVVAADLAIATLGSDTGGSVRQPASFCGIVGLKPTYGAISRSGLIALASSFDQIGPMTKTVEDAETIFHAIAGRDPLDSTSQFDSNKFSEEFTSKNLPIGVPDIDFEGVDEVVKKNFEESVARVQNLGYPIKKIKLPHIKYGISCYYIILPAEASANLARFDGVRYGLHKDGAMLMDDYLESRGVGFGKEVRRRIILGTYVLSAGYYDAYYSQALKVRELIRQDFTNAFTDVRAIMLPTTAGPAFKLGEKSKDPLAMYLEDLFTIPANLAGIPAISIPSGFVNVADKNLPLGIQFMASHFREDILFHISKDFERA